MVAWENKVIAEAKNDRLHSPDRNKEPGKRIPVVTPANETRVAFLARVTCVLGPWSRAKKRKPCL